MSKINKIGITFGDLTVVSRAPDYVADNGRHYVQYNCLCSVCGNIHLKRSDCLKTTFKCKCTLLPKRMTHRHSGTKLYNIWAGIKQRCYYKNNISYKYYGARGIKMDDSWRNDFTAFYQWSIANNYHSDLQIDRIDTDGDYTPSNCRWISQFTNANNKRNNVLFEYNGVTKSAKEWSRYFGINYKTVMTRLRRGWSFDETFEIIQRDNRRK